MTKPEIQAAFEKRADRYCIPLKTVGFGTLATKTDYLAGSSEMLELMVPLVEGLRLIGLGDWSAISGAETASEFADELLANLRTSLEGVK